MSTIVRTQAELDAAIKAGAEDIIIDSPAGAWINVCDSSTVTARGSSTVHAWGSSTVTAGSYTAVHLHSGRATIRGGVLIDHTTVDFADPQAWCDYHGVPVTDGIATVYKAVGPNWVSAYGTSYAPGSTPSALDWRPRAECGAGLHFSPSPTQAREYYGAGEVRYLRVGVAVDQLVPLGDDKCKAPIVVAPCVEVDIHGREVRP